jgi:hypothetical protein
MSLFLHPDLLRALADDRRSRFERQARESHLRREFKRKSRHR